MSDLLIDKLATVRRKRAVVHVLTGVAAALAVVACATALTMGLDYWLDLSFTARAALLAVQLAAAAVLVLRLGVWPVAFGPDVEGLALAVEREWPEFRSRLISAIQLGGAAPAGAVASTSMVSHLVRETEAFAEPLDFGHVVKTGRMARLLALAVALLAGAAAGMAYGGPTAVDLLKRAALVPGVEVPRKTRVTVTTGDLTVAKGDAVTLTATADGVIPAGGTVTLTTAGGDVQTYPMDPDPAAGPNAFVRQIAAVPDAFQYVVTLNDGTSRPHRVEAVDRPAVVGIEVRQVFPKYTGLPDRRQPPGDLTFFAGSRMVLDVTATKKLRPTPGPDGRRSVVRMIGATGGAGGAGGSTSGPAAAAFPLQPDVNDASKAYVTDGPDRSIAIPPGTTAFRVELVDEAGVASRDETEYRVDVLPDRPPTIAVTSPAERDVLVTPKGRIDVGFDVADDVALARLALKYRILPPADEPAPVVNGLTATFFDTRELQGRKGTRIDPVIDFEFGEPGPTETMPHDNWSARWEGQIRPKESGRYVFHVAVDDGVRLFVDGKLLLDKWHEGNNQHDAPPVLLEANKAVAIKVEMFEATSLASLHLLWSREGGPREVVPTECLLNLDADRIAQANVRHRERSIDLDIAGAGVTTAPVGGAVGGTKAARGFYRWDVSTLSADAPAGTSVEWWLEARDTNDVTGPGVTSTDRYVFRVVTEAEKRAELMAKLGDPFREINDVREGQVDLSTRLGTMVQQRPAAE